MKPCDNSQRIASGDATLTASITRYWNEHLISDGKQVIGYVIDRSGKQFEARTSDHSFIGNFPSLRKAMRALGPAP
jgi:hypothetical protein